MKILLLLINFLQAGHWDDIYDTEDIPPDDGLIGWIFAPVLWLVENAELLQDLKEKLEDALFDVEEIINACPDHIKARAKAYWLSHIKIALTNDHDFMGSSMCSMEDTINELNECGEEGAEEENYEDED